MLHYYPCSGDAHPDYGDPPDKHGLLWNREIQTLKKKITLLRAGRCLFPSFFQLLLLRTKNCAAQLQPKIRRWTLVFLSKPCPAPSASEYYRLWMDIGWLYLEPEVLPVTESVPVGVFFDVKVPDIGI